MNENYNRDIDLNLLRMFAVVAETRSVTAASARLYLTQPAVSAALRRLATAMGAPLFVRQGRGVALTSRGARLYESAQPHLKGLIDAALAPPRFDPRTHERAFRIGLSDATESWLLPALLRVLGKKAPRMRLIAVPVQFRSVAAVLASGGVEMAVTVADDLPAGVRRQRLFMGGFVCVFDRRHVKLRRTFSSDDYFAQDHVVVSYNGDLRGIVEDVTQKQRRVRCSVPSFANLGAILDGTPLVGTVPAIVARELRALRPHLVTRPLPFPLQSAFLELLWPAATDDDEGCRFLRHEITASVARATAGLAVQTERTEKGR